MRSVFIAAFTIWSATLFAQQSRLSVHNPAPRLFEEIEIVVTLQKENLDALEKNTKPTSEETTLLRNNQLAHGTLMLNHVVSDTGTLKIGPFRFTIQDKEFITDALTIHIYPPLPAKENAGLWIRIVEYNDESYLLVEQRIPAVWKKERQADNEFSFSLDPQTAPFAALIDEKFEANGINIISSSARTQNQVVNETDRFGNGTVYYKLSTYRFRKTENFKGRFKLDKRFFSDYPKKVLTEEVWVE